MMEIARDNQTMCISQAHDLVANKAELAGYARSLEVHILEPDIFPMRFVVIPQGHVPLEDILTNLRTRISTIVHAMKNLKDVQ